MPLIWPAILTQWALLATGWLASGGALSNLAGSGDAASSPSALAIVLLLPLLALLNLAIAGAAFAWLRLVGTGLTFWQSFVWLSYGAVPLVLGKALGLLLLAIVRPEVSGHAEALAMQISPYSFGAGFIFHPLSFPWFIASYFDVFGLWSMALIAVGARTFVGLSRAQAAWAVVALVIIWAIVVTGLWQGGQRLLSSV